MDLFRHASLLRPMHSLALSTTLLHSARIEFLSVSKDDTSRHYSVDDLVALFDAVGCCRLGICVVAIVANGTCDACVRDETMEFDVYFC